MTRAKFEKSLKFLLSILLSLFLGPNNFFNPSQSTESAWQIAFGYGIKSHLTFGVEFISTYGPLGFMWRAHPHGVSLLVLMDLAVLLNSILIFYRILERTRPIVSLPILLCIVLLWHQDISILLLLVFIFLIFEYINSKKTWVLLDGIFVGTIAFFVKLNTGLLPMVFLVILCIFLVLQGILSWNKSLLFFVLYASIIGLLAFVLQTNLFAYVVNGLSMIRGYGDAMYHEHSQRQELLDLAKASLCVILLLVPFFTHFRIIFQDLYTLFLFLVVYCSLFVQVSLSFMQFNGNQFFGFIVALTALLAYHSRIKARQIYLYTLFPIVLISLAFVLEKGSLKSRGNELLGLIPHDVMSGNLFDQFETEKESIKYSEDSSLYYIPTVLLDKVGSETIDLIPGGIARISDHQLNYTPRPIPLSKFVQSIRLGKLNEEFLEKTGPRYILYSAAGAARRYPMFEEPLTQLALMKHYRTAEVRNEGKQILLERLADPISYERTEMVVDDYDFEQTIEIERTGNILIVYPDIKYTWLGGLFRFIFWPPDLSVTMQLEDNSTATFSFPKSVGESGVIINKFLPPGNISDYELFIDYYGQLNQNIKTIQFTSNMPWAFTKMFQLGFRQFEFEGAKRIIEKNLAPIEIARIFPENINERVRFNFELLKIEKSVIQANGWAYTEDSLRTDLRGGLIFEAPDHYMLFPFPSKGYRPDVRAVLGMNVGDSSGFSCITLKQFLKPATYRMGIGFLNRKNQLVYKILYGNAKIDGPKNGTTSGTFKDNAHEFRFMETDRESDFPIGMDQLKFFDDKVIVVGWAFDNRDPKAAQDTIRIILRSSEGKLWFGKTNPVSRPDVANYLKRPMASGCGFDANILTGSIRRGEYDIGVYLKKTDGKGVYKFVDKVRINYSRQIVLKPFKGKFVEDEMEMSFDLFEETNEALKIEGWAGVKNQDSNGCEISILLRDDNDSIYTSRLSAVDRPDVTEFFKNLHNYDESGFEGNIPKRQLQKGRYLVGILIHYPGASQSIAYFTDHYIEKDF